MREYFNIQSDNWKITVMWCLKLGLIVGLIIGSTILFRIL